MNNNDIISFLDGYRKAEIMIRFINGLIHTIFESNSLNFSNGYII